MERKLIKKYSSLYWIQKGRTFIRKSTIESINDEFLSIRTKSGMDHRFETKKEFEAFVKQLGFNEPG